MQAIDHTLQAMRADSVEDLVDHLDEARAALDELERAKLTELGDKVREHQERANHRAMQIGHSRRPARDNPQA